MKRFYNKIILRNTYYLSACVVREYVGSVTSNRAETQKLLLSEPRGAKTPTIFILFSQPLVKGSRRLFLTIQTGITFFSAAVKIANLLCETYT